MHPRTGEIREFASDEQAEREGFVPITREAAHHLRKKTPDERVEWLETLTGLTKVHPLAPAPGESADDRRQLRNKAKAARRARAI